MLLFSIAQHQQAVWPDTFAPGQIGKIHTLERAALQVHSLDTTPVCGFDNCPCINGQQPVSGELAEHLKWFSQLPASSYEKLVCKLDRCHADITVFVFKHSQATVFLRHR